MSKSNLQNIHKLHMNKSFEQFRKAVRELKGEEVVTEEIRNQFEDHFVQLSVLNKVRNYNRQKSVAVAVSESI